MRESVIHMYIRYCMFSVSGLSSGVFRGGGGIGPWPPFGKKKFHHRKNLENLVCPLCVSTSGQRKFAPLFEILNTPLGLS